jgi:type II secretory pathway component PulK
MLKKIKSQRSSALIIALWALSFLTIFVINLGFMVRSGLQYADHLQDRLKMYCLARAGIERAIAELSRDETTSYDSLNEAWSNNKEFFKDLPLGGGFITLSYNPEGKGYQEETALYGAMDESSKININNAPADILITLLERIGNAGTEEAIDLAAAIVDWRDKDIVISPGGAEEEYYQGLSSSYKCKNGNFQIAEELLLVKGMTSEIFSEIKDTITVYNTEGVNINTASYNCLYALGLTSSLCERIIKFRQGSDQITGTEDDVIFKSTNELHNVGPLFTEEATQINSLITRGIITVKSDVFRINSLGQFKDERGSRARGIVCILKRRQEKGPQILYWHEN